MGLDMYLYKSHYVKYSDDKEELADVKLIKENNIHTKRIAVISEEIMYWGKANAIHEWFVENVQDGVDNCAHYYLGREDLQKLHDIIVEILDTPIDKRDDLAEELLPSTMGIDHYYYEDLKETLGRLSKILAEKNGGTPDYIYTSSW